MISQKGSAKIQHIFLKNMLFGKKSFFALNHKIKLTGIYYQENILSNL